MRLLFLTPQVPYPLYQGTALRNFGLIEALARRGHTITLVTFAGRTPIGETPLPELCERVITVPAPQRSTAARLATLLRGEADLYTRLRSAALVDALSAVEGRFDAAHLEGLEMAPFLDAAQHLARHVIYDAHNAEHALQARIAEEDTARPLHRVYSGVQAARLRTLEARICAAVDHVLACSERDAQLLAALGHSTPVSVVPNAIRTADYTTEGERAAISHPALVFTGKMDFRPNVDAALWFAEQVLPLVHAEVPAAQFTIVGQKPHPRLDRLRAIEGVHLTGFVPAIQPYIRAADVYIAPLRMGSGTRFKLLEAMALGRAVVSTSVGAEGLAVTHGEHLLLADSPVAFAEAAIRLLSDEGYRTRLAAGGTALVRQHYDWEAVIPRVEVVYSTLRG